MLKSCIIGENVVKLLMLEGYDTVHEAYEEKLLERNVAGMELKCKE